MNMYSKKVILPAAALALVGATAFGVSQVAAAGDPTNPQASLVQKIADTFHLDKSKVQAVFDQNRADQQAQSETRYEQMLSQAVTNGQLTSQQKDAVLAEHNKLKSELDAAAGKTGTDRRTAMQQVRTDAQTWAKQNNLPAHWLLGGRPLRGMGPGMMGHGMHGTDNDSDDGTTPQPSVSPSSTSSPQA